MSTPCNQCSGSYEQVQLHWKRSNSCGYPPFPDEVLEVLAGVWGVRGGMDQQPNGRYRFRIMKNDLSSLEHIREVLGLFGTNIHTQEKESRYGGGTVLQCEVGTTTHPDMCRDLLESVTPTALSQKAALTVAGGPNGSGSWKIVLRESMSERALRILEPICSSVHYKSREEWNGESVQIWVPKDTVKELNRVSWPSGWWNSPPYYP